MKEKEEKGSGLENSLVNLFSAGKPLKEFFARA